MTSTATDTGFGQTSEFSQCAGPRVRRRLHRRRRPLEPIPTLSQWMMVLLAAVLGAIALAGMRKRR